MKVLFLDFDGVLNRSYGSNDPAPDWATIGDIDVKWPFMWVNHVQIELVKWIISKVPEVKVVICSTWRRHWSLENLSRILEGIPVFDKTGGQDREPRLAEIERWIQESDANGVPIEEWVWLDDVAVGPHAVMTNAAYGLTQELADIVVGRLTQNDKSSTAIQAPSGGHSI